MLIKSPLTIIIMLKLLFLTGREAQVAESSGDIVFCDAALLKIPYFYGVAWGCAAMLDNSYYCLVVDSNIVVGCAELREDKIKKQWLWLRYVSVAKMYRNQGIGASLIHMIADKLPGLFSEKNYDLLIRTPSTELGALAIEKKLSKELNDKKIKWIQTVEK